MLADDDIEYIRANFSVYDHEWLHYSAFLGEPYLINDVLAYFDGMFLYICAFPLSDTHRELDIAEIEVILASRPEFTDAQAVDIWGRFEIPQSITQLNGNKHSLVEATEYSTNLHDRIVEVQNFDLRSERAARLAINASKNQGLSSRIHQPQIFSARHLSLIEAWRQSHAVNPIHATIVSLTPALLRRADTYIIEALADGELRGFAIASMPATNIAVYLQGFFRKRPGDRAGDSVMQALLEHCRHEGVSRLHLGYSPTISLSRFKEKWGGRILGPSYREAFYSRQSNLAEIITGQQFLWPQRLVNESAKALLGGTTE
jgi:hypothetical protein